MIPQSVSQELLAKQAFLQNAAQYIGQFQSVPYSDELGLHIEHDLNVLHKQVGATMKWRMEIEVNEFNIITVIQINPMRHVFHITGDVDEDI
jgi:hypothetical protein